jgi:hypothetical protein
MILRLQGVEGRERFRTFHGPAAEETPNMRKFVKRRQRGKGFEDCGEAWGIGRKG